MNELDLTNTQAVISMVVLIGFLLYLNHRDRVEIYSNELDRVAFFLLECANPEELRAYEAEGKGE